MSLQRSVLLVEMLWGASLRDLCHIEAQYMQHASRDLISHQNLKHVSHKSSFLGQMTVLLCMGCLNCISLHIAVLSGHGWFLLHPWGAEHQILSPLLCADWQIVFPDHMQHECYMLGNNFRNLTNVFNCFIHLFSQIPNISFFRFERKHCLKMLYFCHFY